jgi:hypothetical protein
VANTSIGRFKQTEKFMQNTQAALRKFERLGQIQRFVDFLQPLLKLGALFSHILWLRNQSFKVIV